MDGFPTGDEAKAYAVTQELQAFIKRFYDRATDSAALERVLDDEILRGKVFGQAPEFFTEENLIVPVLNKLGYGDVLWRPVGLTKAERKEPDLRITDPPTGMVCIVESKAMGVEQCDRSATKQIDGYLQDDTFVKYGTDLQREYLVGIGTDGLDWSLHVKPIGQQYSIYIGEASLRDEIRTLVRTRHSGSPSSGDLVQSARESLAESFVPMFARRNLEAVVREEVECRY